MPFVRELLQRFSDLDTKYRGYEAAMERAYATLANDAALARDEVVPKEPTPGGAGGSVESAMRIRIRSAPTSTGC